MIWDIMAKKGHEVETEVKKSHKFVAALFLT